MRALLIISFILTLVISKSFAIPITVHYESPDGFHILIEGDVSINGTNIVFTGTISGWGGEHFFTGKGPLVVWFRGSNNTPPANGVYFEYDSDDFCNATNIQFKTQQSQYNSVVNYLNSVNKDFLNRLQITVCVN